MTMQEQKMEMVMAERRYVKILFIKIAGAAEN
jgi:hypothetical protein